MHGMPLGPPGFAAAGAPPKFRISGKTMVRILGLFMPIMRELVEMNYLQSTPVNLSDAKLEKLVGPVARTPYDDALRSSVATMRARSRAMTAASSTGTLDEESAQMSTTSKPRLAVKA